MGIQWSVVKAVFARNFQSYFSNPVGYLFIFAFTLAGAFFAFNDQFFAANMADLEQLNLVFPLLALLLVPAITMGTWADERRSGTEELLMTLPGNDWSIVLGKYFACIGIYTAALVFLGAFVGLLQYLGGPDLGLIASTYLGYWFIGVALIAAGMAASMLTSHTTVAFILGVMLCGILVGVARIGDVVTFVNNAAANVRGVTPSDEGVASAGFLKDFLPRLSVEGSFQQTFGRGVVTLSAVWYFISVAFIMLYLNVFLLGRRHWTGGRTAGSQWLHGTIRIVAMLIAVVSLYVFARRADAVAFVDATSERLHQLSPQTLEVLRNLPADREVRIEAFVSPIRDLPKEYVVVQRNLRDMLLQYEAQSRGKLVLNIQEAEVNSAAARRAERSFGIKPIKQGVQEEGKFRTTEFILGVAVTSGKTEQTIPFFYKGLPIEYELTRIIRTSAAPELPKIAVLGTEAEILDRFNTDENDWLIVNDLKKQYKVVRAQPGALLQREDTGPEPPPPPMPPGMQPPAKKKTAKLNDKGETMVADSLKDVQCLIVPLASKLKPDEMDDLLEYLKMGKPTLILEDPVAGFNPRLTSGRGRQPMMPGMPPQPEEDSTKELERLCDFLGIDYDSKKVVWQSANPLRREYADLPLEYLPSGNNVGTSETLFDETHPITAGMKDYVLFLFAGGFKAKGGDGPDIKPLLWTTGDAGLTTSDAINNGLMGMGGGDWSKDRKRRKKDSAPMLLGAQISGKPIIAPTAPTRDLDGKAAPAKPATEPKPLNVVFISDLDFVSNSFFGLRREGNRKIDFENVGFLVNCVDFLAGDQSLIPLRLKRSTRRTLERVERLNKSFESQAEQEKEAAQTAASAAEKDAKAELETLLEQYKDRNSIGLQDVAKIQQKAEQAQNRYEQRIAEVQGELNEKLRNVQFDTQEKLKQQQTAIRFLAVALPSLPVLLIGLVVFLVRSGRELEGVARSRMR